MVGADDDDDDHDHDDDVEEEEEDDDDMKYWILWQTLYLRATYGPQGGPGPGGIEPGHARGEGIELKVSVCSTVLVPAYSLRATSASTS